MAACANDPGNQSSYQPKKESTLTDAQRSAQGKRGSVAPSQLQFGFGDHQQETQEATHEETPPPSPSDLRSMAVPLKEPRTFLGTVPCTTTTQNCDASRLALTFAPSGEWRARITPISKNQEQAPQTDQGCWHVTGTNPLRIALQGYKSGTSARLAFNNANIIHLLELNEVAPNIDYRLTRQADIDPINELNTDTIECH